MKFVEWWNCTKAKLLSGPGWSGQWSLITDLTTVYLTQDRFLTTPHRSVTKPKHRYIAFRYSVCKPVKPYFRWAFILSIWGMALSAIPCYKHHTFGCSTLNVTLKATFSDMYLSHIWPILKLKYLTDIDFWKICFQIAELLIHLVKKDP